MPDDVVALAVLSARDPEPHPGTSIVDCVGRPWSRAYDQDHDDWANWTRDDVDDIYGDPESWIYVAGNFGPVTVTDWGEFGRELPVAECPCFTYTWCGDSRIEHYGLQHHTRCDGYGNHREVPRAVDTDGDGWCLCAKHQEWKRDVQAWAAQRKADLR